jgi:hypothetical protein
MSNLLALCSMPGLPGSCEPSAPQVRSAASPPGARSFWAHRSSGCRNAGRTLRQSLSCELSGPRSPADEGFSAQEKGRPYEEVAAIRETGRKVIASNRRVRRDYTILRTYEAGIVLIGNEVKSLRAGHASLAGAFVQEADGELMLHGLHIPEHAYGRHGTRALYQPRRTRKLLLHRSEIDKIIGRRRSPWRAAGGPLTSGRLSPSGTPTGRSPASSAIGCAAGGGGPAGRAERPRELSARCCRPAA